MLYPVMKAPLITALVEAVLFCSLLSTSSAQPYQSALGLRGGTGATVTYKKFISEPIAFEAIVGSYDYEFFGLSVLFEKHKDIGVRRVQWYWGVGPFLTTARDFSAWGIMGALGLDASFESIPLNFTIDWTPRLRLKSGGSAFLGSVGVGLRYIIQY